jgi:ParB-like chromosome segregation protein Spo0J
MPKKQVALVSSEISLEELQHIEANEKRTTNKPSQLKLKQLHVADQVFQPRSGENIAESIEHIEELARVIRTQGKPLDPVLVVPIGKRFFVVDGHHRLSAYTSEGWKEPIPVEVLDVPLKEAREEAIARNIKNKLPMTKNDKYELAWDLVTSTDYSKAEIEEMTTVSDGTVANMRKALKALKAAGNDPKEFSWREAKSRRLRSQDHEHNEWVDKAAKKLADNITKNAGVKFIRKPEVLARALEMISPGLPAALVEEWLEIAFDLVEQHREELEEERAAMGSLDI